MSTAESRFPAVRYGARLRRAAELGAAAGLDALLITPGPDLRYLIGSRAESFERLTCLVIPTDGSPTAVVVPRLELASLNESAVTELALPVRDWVDGQNPYAIVAEFVPAGGRSRWPTRCRRCIWCRLPQHSITSRCSRRR